MNKTLESIRNEARHVFRIYDMPLPLEAEFIRFAKEEAGNKCWVALKLLLSGYHTQKRLASIEERLKKLENGKIQ